MSIYFVRNDITKMEVDAIVLPANEELVMGRGASTSIFMAAGEEKLRLACSDIGYCAMGECKVTPGFDLPAKFILHAVVPQWEGGKKGEEEYLRSAYRNSLIKAEGLNLNSVAFPVLSSGSFGYPKEAALDIAVSEISEFLENSEMDVYVVLFGESMLRAANAITDDIEEYIDNNYVEEQHEIIYPDDEYCGTYVSNGPGSRHRRRYRAKRLTQASQETSVNMEMDVCMSVEPELVMPCGAAYSEIPKFDPDKSFIDTLYDRIEERGISDPECYKRANMSRKLFNKIKNSPGYTPKKETVFALCIGLRLSLEESEDLLMRAGYAFSTCSRWDLAVKYYIETGNYENIFDVNIKLFDMFEKTLN